MNRAKKTQETGKCTPYSLLAFSSQCSQKKSIVITALFFQPTWHNHFRAAQETWSLPSSAFRGCFFLFWAWDPCAFDYLLQMDFL